VLFNNFGRYDSKIIIQALHKCKISQIKVLAKSSEDTLCIVLNNKVRILDSLAHLTHPLSKLSDAMDRNEFFVTSSVFAKYDKVLTILMKKQLMCYEYLSFENIDLERLSRPSKEHFISSLNGNVVGDQEWEDANRIYRYFKCKNLRDYLRIYNILDCTLLCDIICKYRSDCLKNFKVDLLQFVSSPSLICYD